MEILSYYCSKCGAELSRETGVTKIEATQLAPYEKEKLVISRKHNWSMLLENHLMTCGNPLTLQDSQKIIVTPK